MIQEIQKFSLPSHSSPYKEWPKKTKLYYDEEYTGEKITGYIIEAQFKIDNYYLLIVSYDCPYEESNTFILLDESFKMIAKNEIEVMYSSFLLEDYKIKSDTEIMIKYFGDYNIKLSIHPNKRGLFSKKITYKQCRSFN